MECSKAQARLEVFLDGELAPETTLEMQVHLDACGHCAQHLHFDQAVRSSTRRAVSADSEVSPDFRQRIEQALIAERTRQDVHGARPALSAVATPGKEQTGRTAQLLSTHWRRLTTFAAAAAVLMFWSQQQNSNSGSATAPMASSLFSQNPQTPLGAGTSAQANSSTVSSVEQALDRLIDTHSSPPAPQILREDLIYTAGADVGVRVHAPSLQRFGAFWEEAGIIPVTNHRAAYLRYRMPRRHVTVYVYDPRKVPVQKSLVRRRVKDRTVYLGHWRGYSIAAKEAEGIGYALAADLDDAAIAEIIGEIH